jgi:hypothetical protein
VKANMIAKLPPIWAQDTTNELIRRNCWSLGMKDEIVKYIQSSPECKKNKTAMHKSYGLLQPLELAYMAWSSIPIDVITDLPRSDGCNQLWVIIDRFTRMGHFILLKKNHYRVENLVLVFVHEICRLHGIPNDIVLDRNS